MSDQGYDVIVVGGGLAGLCALNTALDGGATALLIEKMSALGGSSVLSSGLMAFAGTDEQVRAGVIDDNAALVRDLTDTAQGRADPTLVRAYCAQQHTTYRWLRSLGVEFGAPHAGSGQRVARSHPIDTAHATELLARRARSLGGEIRLGVSVSRLVVEGDRVVGVRHGARPMSLTELAGATVLASGGFTRSELLLAQFAPAMSRALRAGGEGNTGDGLLMAAKIGAGLVDLPHVKGTFGIFPFRSVAEEGTGILVVYKGAIAVNGYGERFINESLPYKLLGDACLAQPEGLAYQVFDQTVMDRSDSHVPIYDFRRRLEAGQILQGETLGDVATKAGIDAENLLATVADYNESILSDVPDRFGRTALSGAVGVPSPINSPPFYAFPSTTVVLATYAGVSVDETARVRDVYGEPIPGLYAAGEVTGGFHGAGYVTGSSLGKSAIFGLEAGRRAADFARVTS